MKKVLGWVAGLLVGVAGVAALAGNNADNNQQQVQQPEQQQVAPTPREEAAAAAPEPKPEVEQPKVESVQTPEPKQDCDPNYKPCVPNVSHDLDCSDISFSVTVTGTDRHRFDRDGDGHGCESN